MLRLWPRKLWEPEESETQTRETRRGGKKAATQRWGVVDKWAAEQRCEGLVPAVLGSQGSYLRNVHHSVAAEGSGRGQVVEAQQSGDNAVLINPANHGPIHKEDYTVLIHRNACRWVDSRQTERKNIYQSGLGALAALIHWTLKANDSKTVAWICLRPRIYQEYF